MPDSEDRQENAQPDLSGEIQKADRMGALFVSLPKWIAWTVIAWQIRLSIEVLAGKYALPSLLTRFWRQASAWEVLCWGAGTLGVIFGLYSRYLLHIQSAQNLAQMRFMEKKFHSAAVVPEKSARSEDRSKT